MSKHHKTREMVHRILKLYPGARDDDKQLMFWFYKFHFQTTKLSVIMCLDDAPSFEAITRARRRIQAAGEFPPSEKAQQIRDDEEREYLAEFGKKEGFENG